MEDSEAKLVIADVQRAARLAEPGVQHGAKVVTLDIAQPLDRAIAPITAGGSAETVLPVLTGQDLATYLFTPGSPGQTTGRSAERRGGKESVHKCQTTMARER